MLEWPENITKPELPFGYEWVCLREALGVKNQDGTHPWYARISWKMNNGKNRMLNLAGKYFETLQEALDNAVQNAFDHAKKRNIT